MTGLINKDQSHYMLHILLITPGFPVDENDRTCIPPLQGLVKELAGRGKVKISVLSLHYPYRNAVYEWHGVRVYACGASNKRFPLRFKYWYRAVQFFRKINSEHPVNFIHSFWWSEAALIGHWLGKKYRLPHLTTLMGQEPIQRNLYQRILRTVNQPLVALSSFHKNAFEEKHKRSVKTVVAWGLDKSNLKTPESKSRDIDLLGVGSLIPLKCFEVFIEVVNNLIDEYPGIKCVIVGAGPQFKYLQSKIDEKGLGSQIELTGKVPRPKVMEYMNRSRILFHPSFYESFGYVFAEAMYYGLHIVSRPVGTFHPDASWNHGNSVESFTLIIAELLKVRSQPASLLIQTMTDTAAMYERIYLEKMA